MANNYGERRGGQMGRPILGSRNTNVSQSTLSAEAPAFVPRSPAPFVPRSPAAFVPRSQPPSPPVYHPPQNHTHNNNNNQYAPQYPHYHQTEENAEIEFWSDDIMHQLEQAVSLLTVQPGSMEEVLGPLTHSLNNGMTSLILQQMVDLLIEQSVFEPNFRYTGAKMCSYFTNNLLVTPNGNFRQQLLKRCYEEYSKRDEYMGSGPGCARVCGFTLLIGELLLNLTIGDGSQRIGVFLDALPELLSTILSQPTDQTIKTAVQTLKLSGSILEGPKHENLTEVFNRLKQVLTLDAVSKNSKWMILSVLELRASSWGGETAASDTNSSQEGQSSSWVENGDGEVWSNGALIYEDGMYTGWSTGEEGYYLDTDEQYEGNPDVFDDEMAAAYEAFLCESENQSQGP